MLTHEQAIPWPTLVHRSDVRIFVFVLVVVFPIVDYLLYFRLKSTLQIYTWKIVSKWWLFAVCAWLIRRSGFRLSGFYPSRGHGAHVLHQSRQNAALRAITRARNDCCERITEGLWGRNVPLVDNTRLRGRERPPQDVRHRHHSHESRKPPDGLAPLASAHPCRISTCVGREDFLPDSVKLPATQTHPLGVP
jgi:hypothetical protein